MTDLPIEDRFGRACQYLERIAELKEKNLLEETEYQELRNLFLRQMKDTVSSGIEGVKEQNLHIGTVREQSLPYGQLHLQIVRKISASYKSAGEDTKQRMYKAINEMAENQALYPGDSGEIEKIIEIVFTPLPGDVQGDYDPAIMFDQLLYVLKGLNEIYYRVKDNPKSSPATKAIVETTHQSSNEAAEEIRTHGNKPELENIDPRKLWKTLVLEDLDGGLQGGAAAVTIFSPFAAVFAPLSIPLVAAFGVLVGAGVRSGIAYGDVNKQS